MTGLHGRLGGSLVELLLYPAAAELRRSAGRTITDLCGERDLSRKGVRFGDRKPLVLAAAGDASSPTGVPGVAAAVGAPLGDDAPSSRESSSPRDLCRSSVMSTSMPTLNLTRVFGSSP